MYLTKNGRGRFVVMDTEDYERDCAEKKILIKQQEAEEASEKKFVTNFVNTLLLIKFREIRNDFRFLFWLSIFLYRASDSIKSERNNRT